MDTRKNNKWFHQQTASITLEAAILLPFVMCLFFLIINIYHVFLINTSLRTTVTNSVQKISSTFYPVDVLLQYANQSTTSQKAMEWIQKANIVSDVFPYFEKMMNHTSVNSMNSVFLPLLHKYIPNKVLHPNKLRISKIELPNLSNRNQSFFLLQAQYTHPIHLPLFTFNIVIRKTAVERLWVGEQVIVFSQDQLPVQIIEITPAVLYRGSTATITANVQSKKQSSIRIIYKSGESIAKGLMEKLPDPSGKVIWQWKVGGNTTTGMWTAVVSDGQFSDSKQFEVKRK